MKNLRIIIFILFLLILSGCSTKESPLTSELEIDLAESTYHSKDEIEETVDLLKEQFPSIDTFEDCTLLGIYYSDTSHDSETELIKKDEVEDAIIIDFKFSTGASPNQALTKDSTYYYRAIFTKDKSESKWVLADIGM